VHLQKQQIQPRITAKRRIRETPPEGDFEMTPLGHGGIEPVRWSAGSGFPREIVTPGAYRLGLSEDVHATLRKYCDMKGITARARCLTVGGGSLDAGMDVAASIGGNNGTYNGIRAMTSRIFSGYLRRTKKHIKTYCKH